MIGRGCTLAMALFMLALAARPAVAAPDDAAYRKLNQAAVESHIIPRYKALAAAAAPLSAATEAFCAKPSSDALADLRKKFVATENAWQDIQHVRFGPIDLFLRVQRLYFWPDPRNIAGRQLGEMLAARDPASIAAATFHNGSAAVQGLPALERLIYGEDAAKLSAGDTDATFRCQALRAITANIAEITADVAREWQTGEASYAQTIAKAGERGNIYHAPKEATLDLFKSLATAIEIVADHKLTRPLGTSAKEARPRLTESWRSGNSLANIRHNLAAAEAMYTGGTAYGFSAFVRDAAGDKALDDLLKRAFAQVRASADAISLPLEKAIADANERPKVAKLAKEAMALKALLKQRLAPAIGIPAGFNAMDGD